MERNIGGRSSKIVVGYVRVSTIQQELSLAAQHKAIVAWCATNDATLITVCTDEGISGSAALAKRPGLIAALQGVEDHHANVLLVAHRDRLARDVSIAMALEQAIRESGATVISADGFGNGDSPADEFMRTVLYGFAQYERDIIGINTRVALAAKRKRGEKMGGSMPFGYRLADDGIHLVPHEEEQEILALIRQLRADGLTIRAIVEHLNIRGVPGRGTRWHQTSVVRLLKQERNVSRPSCAITIS